MGGGDSKVVSPSPPYLITTIGRNRAKTVKYLPQIDDRGSQVYPSNIILYLWKIGPYALWISFRADESIEENQM